MDRNQLAELTIADMSVEGQGIGRIGGADGEGGPAEGGMVVFVEGAVPGDRVLVRLTKVKKNYAIGRAEEILEESPLRSGEFDCPGFGQGCGGCPLGVLAYDAQLRIKEKQVRSRLERIAGLADPQIRPICGMAEEDNGGQGCRRYRNKAAFPVSTGGIITRKGGIVENLGDPAVGFCRGGSHEVVDCPDCSLQSPAAMAAADALRRFMAEDNITGYDPRWGKGLMRNMVVKTAFATGEVMVVLGINGRGIPGAAKLVGMLDEAVDQAGYCLESVALHRIKAGPAGIRKDGPGGGPAPREGKTAGEFVTIAGKSTIEDRVGNLRMEISPASFFQVNPVQMKRLYDQVRAYCLRPTDPAAYAADPAKTAFSAETDIAADPARKPVILDLYCGIGSIGLYCADLAEMVIGIESVKDAVLDANRNAVINGIVNARFLCGRVEEILSAYLDGSEAAAGESSCGMNEPGEAGGSVGGKAAADGPGKGKNAAAGGSRSGRNAGVSIDRELKGWIRRADIAILDPPRAGCRKELLDAVAFAKIPRIVYVSCDPATLARDIKTLAEYGYEFIEAAPVDMFPHTGHVETVCLLSQRK
ncbi:MAG: class I SAM-dependent RNA methyltransferase [Bacillota bacterium]|nr:class I SAM-dependent RNA methyltransferase [Bacillota bacterium]